MADAYIRQWATDILFYDKAHAHEDPELEALVDDYRRSLYVHRYEERLLERKMPQYVSEANVLSFYEANKDLYRFVNKEFGIDKMIFAIDPDKKRTLIEMYKRVPAEQRKNPAPVFVEKYNIEEKREPTKEEKLKELFGDVLKVEE